MLESRGDSGGEIMIGLNEVEVVLGGWKTKLAGRLV